MRRVLMILALSLGFAACQKIEQPLEVEQQETIVQTRAEDPFDGTIWEHNTGERYDHYIYFNQQKVNRFLGEVEDGHLQRWSEYNLTGYVAEDVEVVGDEVLFDGELYHKTNYPATDIEGIWMSITVIIAPWDK